MKRLFTALAAAVLAGLAAPAAAAVIWQQTFAPDPSGQTSVPPVGFLDVGFPLTAPSTSALLRVQGGTLADVAWSELATYSIYVWEEFPQGSGNWVLTGDSTYDLGAYSIQTEPTFSSFRFDANNYDACYGADYHAQGVICAQILAFGNAGLEGVLVNASQPFTLTLYAVPEPATWVMMLGGFGLLGLALRARQAAAGLARS